MERRGEGEGNQDQNLCVGAVRQVNNRRSRLSINSSLSLFLLCKFSLSLSLSRTHTLRPSTFLRLSVGVCVVCKSSENRTARHAPLLPRDGAGRHEFRARPLAHFLGLM
jgi:hypothetical protein